SLDIGVSALSNIGTTGPVTRPLGAELNIGMTLFDSLAIVQFSGGFFSPPLSDAFNDPAGVFGMGVLFSPVKYLYIGMRTGMITPIEDDENWYSYGGVVFRVQNPGKGLHYYAESEISFTGILNRFSMGLNFTL
ncbi:MAG: hypothetical protein J7L71_00220, partial [Spirochaetaceae bacterium]|nr:hypothetical protein [Spirochaetaceae bacterium]